MKTNKLTRFFLFITMAFIFISELSLPNSDIKINVFIELSERKKACITSIQEYINIYTNNEIYLNAEEFLRCSYKYDVDVFLMLSQGRLESHYGTKGRAIKTNSVFGVGAWDCGENKNYYDMPNYSIEPYTKYIRERYLSNGRSVEDLLKHGFVCVYGYRYASAIDYEYKISKTMKNIISQTNIQYHKKELDNFCNEHNINIKNIFKDANY